MCGGNEEAIFRMMDDKVKVKKGNKSMKKVAIIIIIYLSIILLPFFTIADIDYANSLRFHYDWENNGNDDSSSGITQTVFNASYITGYNGAGTALSCDGSNDYAYSASAVDLLGSSDDFTFATWINPGTPQNAYTAVMDAGIDLPKNFMLLQQNNTATNRVWISTTDGAASQFYDSGDITMTTNAWQFIVIVKNSTSMKAYKNGTQVLSMTDTSAIANVAYKFVFCANGGNTPPGTIYRYGKYALDKTSFWNRTLNADEISALWNSGTYCDPVDYPTGCFGGGVTPSLTLSTSLSSNVNSTLNPYQFNITGSLTNITNSFNCSMYFNGTLNQTLLNVPLNNTYITFNLTYGFQQTAYNINVTCKNAGGGDSFLKTNVFLDSIPPILSITSTFANNSVYFQYIDNVPFNITAQDANLFAVNVTIEKYNSSGVIRIMNNKFISSLMNVTSYTLAFNGSDAINPENNLSWSPGQYRIKADAWDSHTANEIPDYKMTDLVDGIAFDDTIKITSPDFDKKAGKKVLTVKKEDRYSFQMAFDKSDPTIYLECPDLSYLPESGYKGHFVCFENKKWIDFEDVFGTIESLEVVPVAKDKYSVKLKQKNLLDRLFMFNSIGDLNNVSSIWYFNVSSPFTFYAKDHFSTLPQNGFTVTVNATPVQTRSAGTLNNVSFNITSGIFNASVTHSSFATNSSTVNFSSGGNFTWDLYSTNSIYILVYDETTGIPLSGRNVTIEVINYQNSSFNTTTGTGAAFVSGFSPGQYEINAKADGYQYRSYYTTIAESTTQTLSVYLLNNTDPQNLIKDFKVIDESGNPVSNATASLERFYVSCNCYKVVEMTKTTDSGKSFFFAEYYDVPYIIQVDYGGITRKITPQIKFSSEAIVIKISLISDALTGFYEVAQGTNVLLNFSKDTGIWTYSWSGGTIGSGKLVIENQGQYVTTTLATVNASGTTGTLVFNGSSYINQSGTFVGKGYVTGASGTEIQTAVKSYSYRQESNKKAWGLMGLFLSILMIASFALIAGYMSKGNPSVVVFGALIGFEISILSTMLMVSWVANIGIIISGVVVMMVMRT